jgi:hypothetical protein
MFSYTGERQSKSRSRLCKPEVTVSIPVRSITMT